jgi:hypothetical protein
MVNMSKSKDIILALIADLKLLAGSRAVDKHESIALHQVKIKRLLAEYERLYGRQAVLDIKRAAV